jgi:hypothetical protein
VLLEVSQRRVMVLAVKLHTAAEVFTRELLEEQCLESIVYMSRIAGQMMALYNCEEQSRGNRFFMIM